MLLSKNPIRRRLTLAGVVVAVLLLCFGKQMRLGLLRFEVLHTAAPSNAALCMLSDESSDLPKLVHDLWATGRLTQRHYAAELLVKQGFTYEQARPYLVEALWDVDDDLRENALIYLAAAKDKANLPLFAKLLEDPDPRLQNRALVVLAVQGDLSYAPYVAPLLDSPRPEARAAAYAAFQRWTGHDDGANAFSPQATLTAAGTYWKAWWHTHEPDEALVPPGAPPTTRLPAPEVVAHELSGKRLSFPDWGRVPYVLVFWSQHDARAKTILPMMRDLGEKLGDSVHFVALNVDDMPTVHGFGYEGRHETDAPLWDSNDGKAGSYLQPQQWPWQQGLATLDTVVAYRAQDTPVTVIIDAQGKLCRRLGYDRTKDGMGALIAEAMAPPSGAEVPEDPRMARAKP